MHVTATAVIDPTTDLIHFTTSLLITLVLLVLTLRASRVPGTPLANILFALSGILWSFGGLVRVVLLSAGMPRDFHWVLAAQALQYSGAATFPVAILAVWRPFGRLPWQKTASRALEISAAVSTLVLIGLWWSGWLKPSLLVRITASDAAIFLVAGAACLLRRDATPRAVYFPSLFIVAALAVAALAMLPRHMNGLLSGIAVHLILLMVLCTFLLFARFRLADLFIRYTVRILLAAVWAGLLIGITSAPLTWHLISRAQFPAHALLMVLTVNGLVFSFIFVDERVSRSINRWLFHSPDYRAEARTLSTRLRQLEDEEPIAAAVEESARRPLELKEAHIAAFQPAKHPAALLEGETVEQGDEVLVAASTGGRVTHVLRASPGPARPGLVSHDLDYLRTLATLFGNRLDELARERENIQRQSREALLLQQVTEAELRALRAQINPHFLFNSLNTVADLIVRDPARAETMTLRLASVFRHVLAHSSRPLTTIREEIDFLRTYLHIEEARFGDRLRVEFAVAPAAASEAVPSLILQPLVENALKHGFAPKPGPGLLRISVSVEGDYLRLQVEDDGMGLTSRQQPQGLGLTNVAERLSTLYQDRASIAIEAREGSGCRVTLMVPRGQQVTE